LQLQSQARSDLFILEFGFLAVLAEVNLDFIPHIRPQKDLRRPADLGDLAASAFLTGGLRFIPCALAEARPLALRPPFGFLPSALCHAGDLAIYFVLPILLGFNLGLGPFLIGLGLKAFLTIFLLEILG
jgi:hypothetical protein